MKVSYEKEGRTTTYLQRECLVPALDANRLRGIMGFRMENLPSRLSRNRLPLFLEEIRWIEPLPFPSSA